MDNFFKATALLFVLLNPFIMSIYLSDLIQTLKKPMFDKVLFRGAAISGVVFILFSVLGTHIFTDILQARFASFLIFGGVVFLIIGLRFVFSGAAALTTLRGDPEHLGGSIAMPFMIGPGTVSASVLAGKQLSVFFAMLAVVLALSLTVGSLMIVKRVHDFVRERNERLVARYLEITGRIMALVIGTFAVEMILQGIEAWMGIIK